MKMPDQNPAALALLRKSLAESDISTEQKKMFGHETYFLRGRMFAGVFGDDIFVHVGMATVESSQKPGLGYFEPMGRRMKHYITINPSAQNEKNVCAWLGIGDKFVTALPEKQSPAKKAKSTKKARAPRAPEKKRKTIKAG